MHTRNRDSDGFDEIFIAHVLELRRNTEPWQYIDIKIIQIIEIQDDVLQGLHRWPQHVGETGPDNAWVQD